VNEDCLKLTTYSGERAKVDGRFLAEALIDLYARQAFQASVLLRGTEGFGAGHRLQTDRLESLSIDLPIVTVAIDARPRIEAALPELTELMSHGLVTLERARLLRGAIEPVRLPERLHEETKLTIYCGRQERAEGRPAFVTIVELLHRHGLAGATVLLGVDGTAHGERRRGRFLGRNAEVPLMIIAIGSGATIARALPELAALLPRPLFTLERTRICKRDGQLLAEPGSPPASDPCGLGIWQKLMVFAGELSRHEGRSLAVELIARLRESGALGATALRGIWGYHGDHEPHGDRLLAIRRHVPVVTSIVDTPERIQRAFEVVDELTSETGLVTSELVPALRAPHAHGSSGGLDLASP
jgi:PII-like signaling protein